jgi:tetratricopeptide (TPR) repeat protein
MADRKGVRNPRGNSGDAPDNSEGFQHPRSALGFRGDPGNSPEDKRPGCRVYALYQQGRSRLANGNPHGAAAALEEALAQQAADCQPQKASLHEALGRAYFASSQIQRARAEFERALALDPSSDFAHFSIGRCYERQGRLADAAKHYKIANALADQDVYQAALARVLVRLS